MAYDKEYAAEYFKANKAKISAQRKLRYEANKEKLQKYFREKKQVYKGNIEVISFLANSMKYNATVEELLLFSKAIQERHG